MRVFDGVLYNGEADVLECRLWELAETVDAMVIIEGDKTFTGNVTLGNASSDKVTFTAQVASTIDVDTNNTYNLGSGDRGFAGGRCVGIRD